MKWITVAVVAMLQALPSLAGEQVAGVTNTDVEVGREIAWCAGFLKLASQQLNTGGESAEGEKIRLIYNEWVFAGALLLEYSGERGSLDGIQQATLIAETRLKQLQSQLGAGGRTVASIVEEQDRRCGPLLEVVRKLMEIVKRAREAK